jgi:hypothetical protein
MDTLLIVLRENHFQFTDLRDRQAHYSAWFYDSTFDLHKTFEPHDSFPKRQIPIVKMPFNMETCMHGIARDVCANHKALLRIVSADNSELRDVEFDVVPIAYLPKLFPEVVKGNRWTLTVETLDRFKRALYCAKLGDLSESSPVMGKSSQGHFMLGFGERAVLFDTNKFSEIFEKNIQLSLKP